jgi:hypothetical protein
LSTYSKEYVKQTRHQVTNLTPGSDNLSQRVSAAAAAAADAADPHAPHAPAVGLYSC